MSDNSPSFRKSAPKQGRRSRSDSNGYGPFGPSSTSAAHHNSANIGILSTDDDIGTSDDLLDSPEGTPRPSKNLELMGSPPSGKPPSNARRRGGWASEGPVKSAAKDRSKSAKSIAALKEDSDDDVPVIPELDDMLENDMLGQVAQPPSVTATQLSSYKDLESDLLKHSAFLTLDEIDFRILTKYMVPEIELFEPDASWSWDMMLTEVASDLNAELETEVPATPDSPN